MEPRFLTMQEVLVMHHDQIHRYGGMEGIRDQALLESAIAMPRSSFGGAYLYKSIFEMAAAYLFHIVKTTRFLTVTSDAGPSQRWLS